MFLIPFLQALGLLAPLLSIVELLLPLSTSSTTSPNSQIHSHTVLQFLIEFLNLLSVSITSLTRAWIHPIRVTIEEEKESENEIIKNHHIPYFSSLVENAILRYLKLLQTFGSKLTNISSELSDKLGHGSIQTCLELGLLGQYIQLPSPLDLSQCDNILIPYLRMRLFVGIVNLEIAFRLLAEMTPDPQTFLHSMVTALPTSHLDTTIGFCVEFGSRLSKRLKCLSLCTGNLNVCGALDVVRACPITMAVADAIQVTRHLFKLRQLELTQTLSTSSQSPPAPQSISFWNQSDFKAVVVQLLMSSTAEQAALAFRELFDLWDTKGSQGLKKMQLINFLIGLSTGNIRSFDSEKDRQFEVQIDSAWLSSNPVDALLHLPLILSSLNDTRFTGIADYVNELFSARVTQNVRIDVPTSLQIVVAHISSVQLLELLCKYISSENSGVYNMEPILSSMLTICSSGLRHDLSSLSLSSSVRISRLFTRTLSAFEKVCKLRANETMVGYYLMRDI